MKRLILVLVMLFIMPLAWATNTPIIIGDTVSAQGGASITSNSATQIRSRGVWIGTTQSLDFSFDGTNWITLAGCTAGTLLPIQVVGARKTAAGASPSAGDVVFLY